MDIALTVAALIFAVTVGNVVIAIHNSNTFLPSELSYFFFSPWFVTVLRGYDYCDCFCE